MNSKMKWLWIILALLYFISPFDLIPGIHGVGWIDDVVIIILLIRYLNRIKQNTYNQPPPGHEEHRHQDQNSDDAASKKSDTSRQSPFEVLNIAPNASQQEIKAAYRKLANQYHPDKVAHLGAEFQQLAEKKFKEIQEAYQALSKF